MPQVQINDATFTDLGTLSRWYGTKTPSETIDLIVRAAMKLLGMKRDDEQKAVETAPSDSPIQFDTVPDLTHSRPKVALINGKKLHISSWDAVLIAMIEQVKAKGVEGEKLVGELNILAKAERYEERGYKYYPDLEISVQRKPASICGSEVERLAKKWRIPVMINFLWHQKPKARYPGKSGVLRLGNV